MNDHSDNDHDVTPPTAPLAGAGQSAAAKAARGILCVRCEHLNPLELEECEICKTHLFVKCHECGAKNPRVGARCSVCQRRLHKTQGSSRKSRRGINMKVILLVLGGIAAAIALLIVLAGDNLPRLW